jgi:hypothetical protein
MPIIHQQGVFLPTKQWMLSIADEDLTHLGHIIENDCIQSAMYTALADTTVEFIKCLPNHTTTHNDNIKIAH